MEFDDIDPKPKPDIVIGEDLSSLSVDDLRARIAALRDEIVRIEGDIATKQTLRNAADDVFKKR